MATTLKTVTTSVNANGGASGAYTYRLRLVLNSTDSTANTANISVAFDVQGNNGWYYQSWADTNATMTISTNNGFSTTNNGATGTGIRGYKSTAAGSYTTLANWNGNVSYKSDGTLTVSATVTYGWTSASENYVPVESTISFSNVAVTAITPSTIRYTGTPVGVTYSQEITVARNNGGSNVSYVFRVWMRERSYTETVDANGNVTRVSKISVCPQFKNQSNSGTTWWSSTAQAYQPYAQVYLNGTLLSSVGYVRTGDTSYAASSTWRDCAGYDYTTEYTITHTENGFASATIGLKVTAGTGSYSGPYGPAAYNNSNIKTISTSGGNMLQPPYTITYNANGGSSTPTAWTSTKTNITSSTSKATLSAAISHANTTKTLTRTLKYNANGGTVTPTSATSTAIETTTYTFEKWHLGSVSGNAYAASGTYLLTWFETMVADWTESVSVGSYAAVTLPTPTWAIHKCVGWYTATSGGTKRGNAGASYTPVADVETLYAQWNSAANVKVSGTWKAGTKMWVNVNGTWKEATAVWAKVSGTWEKII